MLLIDMATAGGFLGIPVCSAYKERGVILNFVSDPESESESKWELESIRSPESESERPHHDSAPLN